MGRSETSKSHTGERGWSNVQADVFLQAYALAEEERAREILRKQEAEEDSWKSALENFEVNRCVREQKSTISFQEVTLDQDGGQVDTCVYVDEEQPAIVVCIRMCTCVYMHLCVYVCLCICICVYTYVGVYVCICVYIRDSPHERHYVHR